MLTTTRNLPGQHLEIILPSTSDGRAGLAVGVAAAVLLLVGCAAPDLETPSADVTPAQEALAFSGCPEGLVEALQALEDAAGGGVPATTLTVVEETAADLARPVLDPFLGDACILWRYAPELVAIGQVIIPADSELVDRISEALEAGGYPEVDIGEDERRALFSADEGLSGFYLTPQPDGGSVDRTLGLDGISVPSVFLPFDEPFVVVDIVLEWAR